MSEQYPPRDLFREAKKQSTYNFLIFVAFAVAIATSITSLLNFVTFTA